MLQMLFQRSYGAENRLFCIKKREGGEEREPKFVVTVSRSAWCRVVTELQSEKHIIEMKYIFNGLVSIFNGKMQLKSTGATPI